MYFENQISADKKKKPCYTPDARVKQFWHPQKNLDRVPEQYVPVSKSKAWFLCDKEHEWYGSIYLVAKNGCPHCLKTTCNADFKALHPDLAQEWHFPRNREKLPEHYKPSTRILVWWSCGLCQTSWRESIQNRVENGVLYCRLCRAKQTKPSNAIPAQLNNTEKAKILDARITSQGHKSKMASILAFAQSGKWGQSADKRDEPVPITYA